MLMLYNRQSFCGLTVELVMRILCTLTAAELVNFRCSCIAFNAIYLMNEFDISMPPNYMALSLLQEFLRFEGLKYIAHRCDIAEMLAISIAEHQAEQSFITTIRMAKKIKPYVLALGFFFDGTGLA